jgi:peptide/nickel transport system substrate-binding protein
MNASRRPSLRRGVAALAVASMILAACGGDDDDSAETDEPSAEQDEPADDGADEPADDGGDEPADDGADEPADEPGDAGEAIEEGGEDRDESVDVTLPPEEEDVDPEPGGTLRYGLEADVNGINPTASSLSSPGLMMGNAVFDNLAAQTPEGDWVPYLAESFTPNEDNTQWTMVLREGITFHDGTPLNAEAVQVNFEAQRAHPLVGLAVKPYFPDEDALTIVDDLTVTFNLLDPNAKFPTSLAGQLGMVASPTWLAAALEDGSLNQAPVGTGPFMFDSRSEDSVTRFVRNENWWNGEVYLDAVEFYPVPDSDTRTDLLLGGELEALQTTNQASILDLTEAEQADGSVRNILTDAAEESFAMINSSVPPFDDIRARRALTLATPVDLYNELIALGVNRPADQMFTPDSPYYNPDVVQEHDDPEGAAALVAEYCAERGGDENPLVGTTTCTDGRINIELQWSGPSVVQTRIAELLDEAWSEAGFNVTFDELLQDEHILQTAIGQYNVNTWRQFGAANPANDNVWLMCRNIGGISLNWPRFCDPERDALLLEIMATDDEEVRIPLLQELVQKINQDYLYIFFNHTLWDNAFASNVRGVCERTAPDGTALECESNGRTWFSSVWMTS